MPGLSGLSGPSGLSGIFGGALSYAQLVIATGPIAYWIQGEAAGLVAVDQINSPAQDGAYTGVTLGQPGIGDGNTSPYYDGANDYTNIFTVPLQAAINGNNGTCMLWGRVFNVGIWTDGNLHTVFGMIDITDSQEYVFLSKPANNTLRWRYSAGGVILTVDDATMAGYVDWFCMIITWDKAADQMRAFFNGVQTGATQNGLGVWAGTIDRFAIGSGVAGAGPPVSTWNGWLAHCAIWNRTLTPTEIAALAVLP